MKTLAQRHIGKYKREWQPNTFYEKDDLVYIGGMLYVALITFTSSSVFNPSNWECPITTNSVNPLSIYVRGRDSGGEFSGNDFSGATDDQSIWDGHTLVLSPVPSATISTGVNVFIDEYTQPIDSSKKYSLTFTRRQITPTTGNDMNDYYADQVTKAQRFSVGFLTADTPVNANINTGNSAYYGLDNDATNYLFFIKMGRSNVERFRNIIPFNDYFDYASGTMPAMTVRLELYFDTGTSKWTQDIFINNVFASTISDSSGLTSTDLSYVTPFFHSGIKDSDVASVEEFTNINMTVENV